MNRTVSEAIGQACFDAGVKVITYVPGQGGNEVFDDFCKISGQDYPVSFNEEVAFSMSHGAAICGSRAATIIKSHGY